MNNKNIPKTIALLSIAETFLKIDDSTHSINMLAAVALERKRLETVGNRTKLLRKQAMKYAKALASRIDKNMFKSDIYPFVFANELCGAWYGLEKIRDLTLFNWNYIDAWEDAKSFGDNDIIERMGELAAGVVNKLEVM